MTQVQTIQHAPVAMPVLPREVRLCWTAHSGRRRDETVRCFVLDIIFISSEQAAVEAWVQQGARADLSRCVLGRQILRSESANDEHLLHIDVFGKSGEDRLAAISILMLDEDQRHPRLLYACTPLLSLAGFRPGGYDSPTLKLSA